MSCRPRSPLLTSRRGPHGLRERVSWTDLEGGDLDLRAQSNSSPKYRTKARSVQQERPCSEKAAHRQEERPTARDTRHRENFRNNFKNEVSFKILLNKSVIFKMNCHLISFFKERVYIYIYVLSITESLCCTTGINNILNQLEFNKHKFKKLFLN